MGIIATATAILTGSKASQEKWTKFFLPFLLMLFAATSASAQWRDNDGEPLPDTEWRRTEGTFGIMQLLTSEPEAFFENWDKPTEGVGISTTDRIERGRPIVAVILFSGCQPDANNNCNLEVAYRVLKPSGEVYADTGRQELWIDKPVPPEGVLQLGVNYLGTIIEPDDPLGEYRIYAAVRDLNSGKQLLALQRFTAFESE